MGKPKPFYADKRTTVFHGSCLDVRLADNSIDSIITDPPYALSFMGKEWDNCVPGLEFWTEFLRVAKPGAMLCAFGGTRTFHRMACAIEDAGWEIRDCLIWLYGTGFPKSMDISKAIDKAAGAEREVIGRKTGRGASLVQDILGGKLHACAEVKGIDCSAITALATEAAKLWQGWGTALKPAWESIIVAMKPLEGTYAQNSKKWGVAGLNIDGSRVGNEPRPWAQKAAGKTDGRSFAQSNGLNGRRQRNGITTQGRWPANVLHDGSEEVEAEFAKYSHSKSPAKNVQGKRRAGSNSLGDFAHGNTIVGYGDTGSPSRFFYCAKASRAERDGGCENLPERAGRQCYDPKYHEGGGKMPARIDNNHPCVKPLALMEYLCRLTATPTGGIVYDPFCGSGSTLLAARNVGRKAIGVEMQNEYCKIVAARLRIK